MAVGERVDFPTGVQELHQRRVGRRRRPAVMGIDAIRAMSGEPGTWAWASPRAVAIDQDPMILDRNWQLRPFGNSGPSTQPAPVAPVTGNVPDWPSVLFEDCIALAFTNAEAELQRVGADPTLAFKAFKSAAEPKVDPPPHETLPEAEQASLKLRLAAYNPPVFVSESDGLAWEPLPFYRGYGLLWIIADGRSPRPLLICTRDTDATAPVLPWTATEGELDAFESQLGDSHRIMLNGRTAFEYVRFRQRFAVARVLETADDLPGWVSEGYGEDVRQSLAPWLRPPAQVFEGEAGAVVAAFIEVLVDRTHGHGVALSLWTVGRDTVSHSSHPLLVTRTAKYPARGPEHIWPLAVWNLAAGLHGSDFTTALAPYAHGESPGHLESPGQCAGRSAHGGRPATNRRRGV